MKADKIIKSYLEKSLEDLYQEFENQHKTIDVHPDFGFTGQKFKYPKKFSNWFQLNKPTLKREICEKYNLCQKIKNKKLNNNVEIIAAVSDVIGALTIGISPFLVSTILFKLGLDKICGCNGNNICHGIKTNGLPCSRQVKSPEIFCWQHKKQ